MKHITMVKNYTIKTARDLIDAIDALMCIPCGETSLERVRNNIATSMFVDLAHVVGYEKTTNVGSVKKGTQK